MSRLSFSTVTNSKDVPCFMEVFVNPYTGGVSFLLECLQGLVRFLFLAFVVGLCLGACGCAWVCTRGACARCVPRDAPLYIPVQTGVGVWFSRLSPDECIFCLWFPNKSVAVPFFLSRRGVVSPSFPLPPFPVSPVSPVVVADPDVFGTTLKFLLKKNKQTNKTQKKKTLKIIKKNKSPA